MTIGNRLMWIGEGIGGASLSRTWLLGAWRGLRMPENDRASASAEHPFAT